MKGIARRRSSSASRTIASDAANLVGRIGASLRISARKKAKEKHLQNIGTAAEEDWLQSGVHYAKMGVQRRRSTRSAIYYGGGGSPYTGSSPINYADQEEEEEEEEKGTHLGREEQRAPLPHHRSMSVVADRRMVAFGVAAGGGGGGIGQRAKQRAMLKASKSSLDFADADVEVDVGAGVDAEAEADEDAEGIYYSRKTQPQFIDANSDDDDDDDEDGDANSDAGSLIMKGSQEELLSLALVPLQLPSKSGRHSAARSRSVLSSPTVGSGSAYGAPRSCPLTPKSGRRYLKEGATQLTSLSTLSTHHRYLFLFNDLLLVSKQKWGYIGVGGENSYKLKEKVSLDHLWVHSNNCTHSFLIGWPIRNYVAHFSCESEKSEWFQRLQECIQRRHRPKSTTIGVAIRIQGREQFIRHEIHSDSTASKITQELLSKLQLPTLDPNLEVYELLFESGVSAPSSHSAISSNSSSGGGTVHPLNGVECVYAILMEHISTRGLALSDSQLAHLDTCPMVGCRLGLRQTSNSNSGGSGGLVFARANAALNLVNQFKKVLSRTESSSKQRIFGRKLEGTMPPQPVLTMIDHLMMYGAATEGVFRKSPKHATVRILKAQLDAGTVPDFHQFNVHVTASLLKEYLRSIPGHLLISANAHLWMEVGSPDSDHEKQLRLCRSLLRLLPPSHTVLLRALLRLLRRISSLEKQSKMSIDSLAICLAPSLLEGNPSMPDSARLLPKLLIFLLENASELLDNFAEFERNAPPLNFDAAEEESRRLHQSTDSGLSGDGTATTDAAGGGGGKMSASGGGGGRVSPDSALFDLPSSDYSGDDDQQRGGGVRIEELKEVAGEGDGDEDRTPVLSRENSDAKAYAPQQKQFSQRYQWQSHLMATTAAADHQHTAAAASMGHSLGTPSTRSSISSTLSGGDAAAAEAVQRQVEGGVVRRVLRLKPNSASPMGSPLVSATSRRFQPPSEKVNSLDALKVSDYIISHKKVKSNDSATTLTATSPSPLPPPQSIRKTSSQSIESTGSTASSAKLRRTALLTKQETLGMQPQPAQFKRNNSAVGSGGVTTPQRKVGDAGGVAAMRIKSQPVPAVSRSGSLARRAAQQEQGEMMGAKQPPAQRIHSTATTTTTTTTTTSTRPTLTGSRSCTTAGGGGANKCWRPAPPKRTADDDLEVKWSVATIRSVFQQQKDAKPVRIDTLYSTRKPTTTTAEVENKESTKTRPTETTTMRRN